MYMEVSQGNSLCRYLKQTEVSFFFFYKIGEQEDRRGPVSGVRTSGRREDVGKRCRRVNTVQILYTHISKWKKMRLVVTITGMGGGGERRMIIV
jgi:hypothetical protein